MNKPVYLDCNATTPIEPEVAAAVIEFMVDNFGNAGSRTHAYGLTAKQAVNRAREAVAAVVDCSPEEVIFTSGATESNNIAILGIREYAKRSGRQHIVSTQIEHKAVLEPLSKLGDGFEIDLVKPNSDGVVELEAVTSLIRPDTILVSMMHVNNETGVIQPVSELASFLSSSDVYFHVDAAQSYGKCFEELRNRRIDLISVSGHKIYGPKGIGALITRRRGYERPPLVPLMYGGGQETGLRPGTLPVGLIVGFGMAAEIALRDQQSRHDKNLTFRREVMQTLSGLGVVFNGDPERSVPTTINFSIPGIDSEALMVALKGEVAISNGSACTSHSYNPSHVLAAMGLDPQRIQEAVRLSWCHLTPTPDWESITARVQSFQ